MAPPHLKNNFSLLFSVHYPEFTHVYCDANANHTNSVVTGVHRPLIGAFYIAQFLIYFAIYLPSLIVIARQPLRQLACYKLMLVVGLFDNAFAFGCTVVAGAFSLAGVNYCANTALVIVVGHVLHSLWLGYCMACVVLALNRYVELRNSALAEQLFGGRRAWLWVAVPLLYGSLGMSAADLPVIYNSDWSVFLFQIDVHNDGPVLNWFCLGNSLWIMFCLVLIYSCLFAELRRRSQMIYDGAPTGHNEAPAGPQRQHRNSSTNNPTSELAKTAAKRQRRVQVQCFAICFVIFGVSATYAVADFIAIPEWLAHFAMALLQLGCGSTGIIYLVCNPTIRAGVKQLLLGRSSRKTGTCATAVHNHNLAVHSHIAHSNSNLLRIGARANNTSSCISPASKQQQQQQPIFSQRRSICVIQE